MFKRITNTKIMGDPYQRKEKLGNVRLVNLPPRNRYGMSVYSGKSLTFNVGYLNTTYNEKLN